MLSGYILGAVFYTIITGCSWLFFAIGATDPDDARTARASLGFLLLAPVWPLGVVLFVRATARNVDNILDTERNKE